MMEESGIETTPPASPTPPLSAAATVGAPPMTTGKILITTSTLLHSHPFRNRCSLTVAMEKANVYLFN